MSETTAHHEGAYIAQTAHHGEYWLTWEPWEGDLTIWTRKPTKRDKQWFGDWIISLSVEDEIGKALRPLADPEKPVRIRLKMTAERIEE